MCAHSSPARDLHDRPVRVLVASCDRRRQRLRRGEHLLQECILIRAFKNSTRTFSERQIASCRAFVIIKSDQLRARHRNTVRCGRHGRHRRQRHRRRRQRRARIRVLYDDKGRHRRLVLKKSQDQTGFIGYTLRAEEGR